jgi:hypothetical protein
LEHMEVIKVEHLYKQYRLGQVGTGSLIQDANRWWHKVRGKADPYEVITETNDRTTQFRCKSRGSTWHHRSQWGREELLAKNPF